MSSNERTAEAVASDEETPPIRLPEPVSACQVHLDTPAPDGTSGTFLASSGQRCIRAGQGDVGPELVYDLSPWAPLGEVEDLAELVLGLGGFGEHPSGLWAATGGGVDQDGLLDVGELGEHSSRTEWCCPAWSASRRIRWAIRGPSKSWCRRVTWAFVVLPAVCRV